MYVCVQLVSWSEQHQGRERERERERLRDKERERGGTRMKNININTNNIGSIQTKQAKRNTMSEKRSIHVNIFKNKQIRQIMAAGLFGITSTTTVFVNKAIFSVYHFDAPATLVAGQMMFALVLIYATRTYSKIRAEANRSKKRLFENMSPDGHEERSGKQFDTHTRTHAHNSHAKSRIVHARERIRKMHARMDIHVQRRLIMICACVSVSPHARIYIYIYKGYYRLRQRH